MLYTGIDYHRSFSYLTTMNEKGEVVSQKNNKYEVTDKGAQLIE